MSSVQVSETSFSGSFSKTASGCADVAGIVPDQHVSGKFNVYSANVGSCSVTFSDNQGGHPATLSITVTQASITISSIRRH
jgi:hypothetical protein